MGWQLFPTGIGWRSFDRTMEEGLFRCPNLRCIPTSEDGHRYRLRSARNWATVLFVPLIPLNRTGWFVQCRECRSALPVDVLGGNGHVVPVGTSRNGATDPDVLYDLGGWDPMQVAEVRDELAVRAVAYKIEEPAWLVVDKRHESLVDNLVAAITGEAASTLDAAPSELEYLTADWNPSHTRRIMAALAEAGVQAYFDDGALVVPRSAEAIVDEVVEHVTGDVAVYSDP